MPSTRAARVPLPLPDFTVIGVLAPKGQTAFGHDQDDTIMMPWTTAKRRILGKDMTWLDDILCSAVSTDARPAAVQISSLLRRRHHIAPGAPDDRARPRLAGGADALALGFAVAVGVVFGYYPATRASRLDPIEALRAE